MHPAQEAMLKYFEYQHLPEYLADVSRHFAWLAHALVDDITVEDGSKHQPIVGLEGPELTVALRKLLEAKDCAVRAAL